ncbi:MAG: Ig domain-containing protein [Candidatus Limisoma sp.]
MNKIIKSVLVALFAAATATASAALPQSIKAKAFHNPFMSEREAAEVKAGKAIAMTAMEAPAADFTCSVDGAWGMLEGPDGSTWYFTQTFTMSESNPYFYASSDVKIFNDKHEEVATLNIPATEGEKCNQIQPFGMVTKKLFDRDEKTWEVMILMHSINADYQQVYKELVYNNNGELVCTYDYENAMFFDNSEGWDTFQRVVFFKEEDGNVVFDFYRPGGWQDTKAVLCNTIKVPANLVTYVQGSIFSMQVVDNEPYFTLPHYEKEYFEPGTEMSETPTVNADNNFVVDIYSKDCELLRSIKMPVEIETGALYTFHAFGFFAQGLNMTKGFFSGDDKMNYVITTANYISSTDSDLYSFHVYNDESQRVKTIQTMVDNWYYLNDIDNHEAQMAFLVGVDGENAHFEMLDLPSCSQAAYFPALVNGDRMSEYFNRYAKDDTYQYVFVVGNADADDNGNVITKIGWYNIDTSLDHHVKFNLGPNCELFSALLNETTLDPYTFNTDDAHDYLFLAKIKDPSTGKSKSHLYVGGEDGTIYHEWQPNETGEPGMISVFDNILFVAYYDQVAGIYTLNFHDLPLDKFSAGGDGTAENPYKVSTIGDLALMEIYPNASFELVNDLDFAGQSWTPVNFAGTLDGNNHVIHNLVIENDGSGAYGLISAATAVDTTHPVVVKNLIFTSPKIALDGNCYAAGVVAATAACINIDNVQVFDAEITGNNGSMIGGLVGQATYFSKISNSYVDNFNFNTPGSSKVGGIVGDIRTSTEVVNCAAVGEITAGSAVGGLIGATDANCTISNCLVDVTSTAKSIVGGLIGSLGRSKVTKCYTMGEITATEPDQWSGAYGAGGLFGEITTDWSGSTTIIAENNLVALDAINVPDNAVGVHRIAGITIFDEQWEAGETPWVEKGLKNNYAFNTLSLHGVEAGETTVEGLDVDDKATDKAFFEGLGFVYGTTADAPWVDFMMPYLYFMEGVKSIAFSQTTVCLDLNESINMSAKVYGLFSADNPATFTSSNPEAVEISNVTYDDFDESYTFTITRKAYGEAVITATAGNLTATCTVINPAGAVSILKADNALRIVCSGNVVKAQGARSINVYNMQGVLVANSQAEEVTVDAHGLLMAVATDAYGNRKVAKIFVR